MKHFSLYLTLCKINHLHLQTLTSIFAHINTELLNKSQYNVHQEDPTMIQHDQVSIVFISCRANFYFTFQFTVTPHACNSPNIKIKFPNIKNIILSNVALSTQIIKFGPNLTQLIFLLQAQNFLSLYLQLFISFKLFHHSSLKGQADSAWEIYTV